LKERFMDGSTLDCQAAFEEWASMTPLYDLDKDGDGDYENEYTRFHYRAFEAGYKAGIWASAVFINNSMCDEIGRLQQEVMSLLSNGQPATEQGV
jgi:hypothetical protein